MSHFNFKKNMTVSVGVLRGIWAARNVIDVVNQIWRNGSRKEEILSVLGILQEDWLWWMLLEQMYYLIADAINCGVNPLETVDLWAALLNLFFPDYVILWRSNNWTSLCHRVVLGKD